MFSGIDIEAAVIGTLLNDAGLTAELSSFGSSFGVFTYPIPPDAAYPMVVVSSSSVSDDDDGLNHHTPRFFCSVTAYAKRDSLQSAATAARASVISIADKVFSIFHRQRPSAFSVTGYTLSQSIARQPVAALTGDDIIVGRRVELTLELTTL